MKPDDLDPWLVDDDAIVPSSGFTASVMEAVEREASMPPAIPFPWKRALPGLAALVVALLATVAGITLFGVWQCPMTAVPPDGGSGDVHGRTDRLDCGSGDVDVGVVGVVLAADPRLTAAIGTRHVSVSTVRLIDSFTS